MKTRNGFVSNSSSSSFVCDICGERYEGWDASPFDSDFDCSVCENEHIMCNKHLLNGASPIMKKGCEHEFDRKENKFCSVCGKPSFEESDDGYISSESCPICQFQDYSENQMSKYLEKTRGISRDEVFKIVKTVNKRRKKLYDAEYISYVCNKFGLTDELLLKETKDKFTVYKNFEKFIYER